MNTIEVTAWPVLPDGLGSQQADGAYPRTVRHFGGQTLITEPPSRYVAISTGNLDGAVALGVIPVAATRNDSGSFIPAYLRDNPHAPTPDVARDLDDTIDLGPRTAPDLARVAQVEPTLITASYRGYGGMHYDELATLGPIVLPEGKGFNWKQDFLLLASALGRTEQATTLLQQYHDRATQVAKGYRSAGSPTISVARFGPKGLETHGTWSFCGSVLTDIGAHRPADQSRHDNGTRIDLTGPDIPERLSRLAGGLILYTRVEQSGADTTWHLAQGNGWDDIEGAKHQVDAARWHGHAGPLAALAVLDQLDGALGRSVST